MSYNAYQKVVRDTEAARRGAVPPVANRPQPAQSFGKGTHSGEAAAISPEIKNYNQPKNASSSSMVIPCGSEAAKPFHS
jgi:hypothetical protein